MSSLPYSSPCAWNRDQFAKANKLLSQNASISNDELADLKRKHKEEVDGLVKKANQDFQKMLTSQLEAQDRLKEELEHKAQQKERKFVRSESES